MTRLSGYLIVLFFFGLFLALVSTLEPWIDETFREEKIDIESDIEKCGKYPPLPRGVSGILYCKCNDKISQLPGKCR